MKSISYEEAAAFGDPVALGEHIPNHDYTITGNFFTSCNPVERFYQISWNSLKEIRFSDWSVFEYLDEESKKHIVAVWRIKQKPEYKERINFNQRAEALKNRLNPAE